MGRTALIEVWCRPEDGGLVKEQLADLHHLHQAIVGEGLRFWGIMYFPSEGAAILVSSRFILLEIPATVFVSFEDVGPHRIWEEDLLALLQERAHMRAQRTELQRHNSALLERLRAAEAKLQEK